MQTTLSSASGGEDVCIMLVENDVVNTYVVIIFMHYIYDWWVAFQHAGHPPATANSPWAQAFVGQMHGHSVALLISVALTVTKRIPP